MVIIIEISMTYYKAFSSNLTCRGYQYEVGKTFKHFDTLEMCKSGFHCCSKPLDCLRYYTYPFILCEVTIGDIAITEGVITVTSEITIVREIVGDELDKLLTGEIIISILYGDVMKTDTTLCYEGGKVVKMESIGYKRYGKNWVETKK